MNSRGRNCDIVVVGASVAGVSAITELRRLGHYGRIVLIGAETHQPYTRPPLSKTVLKGVDEPGELALPELDSEVEVWLGTNATSLSLEDSVITTSDRDRVPFGGLVIATGARARRLRPETLDELVLRTLDDCEFLRDRLGLASTVLVVGGGFLGMEVASAAIDLNKKVTVVDIRPPLRDHLGRYLSDLVLDAARRADTAVQVSPGGVELLGTGPITGVRLDDGTIIEADVVISAVGCEPNVEWLARSGAEIRGGVHVDALCRVGHKVVAAGDVVRIAGPTEVARRTPVWMSALDQGRLAANALLLGNQAKANAPTQFFWTEAFGLSLRIAGPLPVQGPPSTSELGPGDGSRLLSWQKSDGERTMVAINWKIPVPKLRRMACFSTQPTAGTAS